MIDVTKPLELDDGTPAVLTCSYDGPNSAIIRVHFGSGARDFSRRDGTAICSDDALSPKVRGRILRNVGDAPKLDLTKPLQTRSGLMATYIATHGDRLIVEVARYGSRDIETRRLDGRTVGSSSAYGLLGVEHSDDVVNKAPTRTQVFRNVYANASLGATAHTTRDDAAKRSKVGKTRVGILTITMLDGEVAYTSYEALKPHTRSTSSADSIAIPQGRVPAF